ncbi:MAG: SpaH/EbpB family LPXTG-anchored major pilin [Clostridiales bacterium]|nr:SpaH/EbpB family LPXTG-anchored major pilin [Clostridiales bacterium]
MKRMRQKRGGVFAVCTALLLMASMMAGSLTVMAATGDTIDYTRTGTLTIYKYDQTELEKDASIDLNDTKYTADGERNSDAETDFADYALQGVVFTYLRVGDIDTYTYTDSSSGETVTEVVYGIDVALANILGLDTADAVKSEPSGTPTAFYYTSDTINSALSTVLTTDNTTTKNSLESYISSGGTKMTATNENGMTTQSGLELGLYLIVETYVPESVNTTTDPFFVSLPMTTSGGSEWMYSVYAYPKNQTNNPTIDKVVKSDDAGSYADTATASEGDTLTYRIVTKLPTITSEATYLTQYKIVDTLDKGLEYVEDTDSLQTVTVSLWSTYTATVETQTVAAAETLTKSTNSNGDYTLVYGTDADGKLTMTIELTKDVTGYGLQKINPTYSGYYLVVEYEVKVTSDANVVLGDGGNENTADLTYGRTNDEYYQTIEDKNIVYSYGLNLTKTLTGTPTTTDYTSIGFVLYNKIDNYYVVASKSSDGVYYVTGQASAETDATTFNPSSTGSLIINGLEADTYELTEVQTASGYSLLSDSVEIVITATSGVYYEPGTATLTQNKTTATTYTNNATLTGTLNSASATVDGADTTMIADRNNTGSGNALADLTVINTKTFTLPQTGGMGTILFTLGGAVLIILGVFWLSRRKKNA